ncbi:hypothetical protein [Parvularcula sp. LCG005]|uniref:hypothetical protein n=1 Tax=Parvularcula sp. LCG005 TaxID=3078805 RepID=UPI0029439865|nr:hypothetical protein [Parvularcula sp. LCG005]WOI53187.1 hypothetical protein RUI03_13650 [Parvularcula sp. LCG005]
MSSLFASVLAVLLGGQLASTASDYEGTVFIEDGQVQLETPYSLEKCAMAVRSTSWAAEPRDEGIFQPIIDKSYRTADVIGTCAKGNTVYLITTGQIVAAPPKAFIM